MRNLAFRLAIGLLMVTTAAAAEPGTMAGSGDKSEPPSCCSQCGGRSCCHKVCVLVCATAEQKKTVWAVQCKDFCVPMPRLWGGKCASCGETAACGACDQCAAGKPCQAPPKCGPVRTRKELVKKEIVCKVPVYKCVVVCCGHCAGDCGACQGGAESAQAAAGTASGEGAAVSSAPEPGDDTPPSAPVPPPHSASTRNRK